MVNYFSDPVNSEDPSYFNISYGFYFKNENDVYVNNVIDKTDSINIINKNI